MRVTVQGAAEMLKVSEKTIYRWIKQGMLPVYRVSDQYRFNRAELLAWASSRRLNVSEDLFHESLQPTVPLRSLSDAILAGGIAYRMEATDKSGVLRQLADSVRLPEEVDRDYLYRLFLAREGLGSTGVGDGLAVPQLIYPNSLELSRGVILLAFLENPVPFEALDGLPVHCCFALVCPTIRGYVHLSTRLHYAFRDPQLRKVLAEPGSREEILRLVTALESGLTRADP